jgi:hypothetical protein
MKDEMSQLLPFIPIIIYQPGKRRHRYFRVRRADITREIVYVMILS